MATSWIQTYTGKKVYPFDFKTEDFDIQDVAQALSQQSRYSGHTNVAYSVAEHCVRVLWALQRLKASVIEQRWGLLHDASEAYLIDLPSPIKNHPSFKAAYESVEAPIQAAIMKVHKLPTIMPVIVKEVDSGMVAHEATALFDYVHPDWPIEAGRVPPIVGQVGWKAKDARDSFLWHYKALRLDIVTALEPHSVTGNIKWF